tara:strand:- start:146619 stop:148256 length:1638 start_codon:yes stop_codon:yes gene_type:complete
MSGIRLGKHKDTNEDVKMGYGTLYKGPAELKATFYAFIDWYNSQNEFGVPRHGLYSITSRRTNAYIFDHPAVEKLCSTAFTNGEAIFFNAGFFKELLSIRKRDPGKTYATLEFVHTHELSHIMKEHMSRMSKYSDEEANIFQDIHINIGIMDAFPEWELPEDFTKPFYGFSEEEKQDYRGKAEETIARIAIKRRNEKLEEKGKVPSQATSEEKMKALNEVLGKNPDENTSSKEHTVTMQDFIEALTEAGDKDLLKAMGLHPDMTDEEIYKARELAKQRLENDLAEAKRTRSESANGLAMPGGHIEDEISMDLTVERKGKLSYKLAIADMIVGEGMMQEQIDDIPDSLYFIDPTIMNMSGEVYLPGEVSKQVDHGAYIFLLDTSASVSDHLASELTTEIRGIFEENDLSEAKVLLVSADTISRGVVLEITRENYDTIMDELVAYGRGGTDLTAGINTAMKLVKDQYPEHPIKGIVYGTDLGDIAPKRESLPKELPPLVFITSDEYYNTQFDAGVSDYATVCVIEEGNTIDLTGEHDTNEHYTAHTM